MFLGCVVSSTGVGYEAPGEPSDGFSIAKDSKMSFAHGLRKLGNNPMICAPRTTSIVYLSITSIYSVFLHRGRPTNVVLDARQIIRIRESRAFTVTHSSGDSGHGMWSSNATLSSSTTAGKMAGRARVSLFRIIELWYPLSKMAGDKV
jgi:hypothetical protein